MPSKGEVFFFSYNERQTIDDDIFIPTSYIFGSTFDIRKEYFFFFIILNIIFSFVVWFSSGVIIFGCSLIVTTAFQYKIIDDNDWKPSCRPLYVFMVFERCYVVDIFGSDVWWFTEIETKWNWCLKFICLTELWLCIEEHWFHSV